MPLKLNEAPTVRRSLGRMSYAQFLKWDGDNQHVEWVNGEVIEMAPVSGVHSDVCLFLAALIKEFVIARRLGFVRQEPFQMKTGPDLPSRAPDVLYVSHRKQQRVKKTYMNGPADLVVEVISPGTEAIDRGEKFYEYEQGGVREYWLIDPLRRQAEIYRRDRAGVFRQAPAQDGVYHCGVLKGLWVRIDWIWRARDMTIGEVSAAWKLEAEK